MNPLRRYLAVPLGLTLLLVAGAPAWAPPAVGAGAAWAQAPAAGAPVQVYPVPGTRTVSPGSQISFRGVSSLPPMEVLGSVSGPHTGRVVQHGDRAGASFVPAKPFTPGETVTVKTPLAVTGSTSGTFTYTVARPTTASPSAPSIYPTGTGIKPNATTAGPYRSRPDLLPPKISVTVPPGTAHAPGLNFASSGQGGMTFWSPATGANAVQGAILGRWLSTGAETGSLGYPVTDEYAVPGGRRSDFQRGSLVWDAATGNVTVQ